MKDTSVQSAVQKLERLAKQWPPKRDGAPPLTQADGVALLAVIRAADALVAHIGAHGKIHGKHTLTLDCLEALNEADPK